jgi:hypothetical protein
MIERGIWHSIRSSSLIRNSAADHAASFSLPAALLFTTPQQTY